MEEYYMNSPDHNNYHEINQIHDFNHEFKELINNEKNENKDNTDNEYNINNNNYGIFEGKEDVFLKNRKIYEYKKINSIRAKLLKVIDKEVNKYSKQKTMINSQTTPNYIKSFFNDYRINLKTKQIKSSMESGVSFDSTNVNPYIKKLIDLDLHPYIYKFNHHYHKFKKKKKMVLSKQSKNFRLESNIYDSSPISLISENEQSPNRERLLYIITGKISKKNYFDYLHSLFYTFHKDFYSGKFSPFPKYASGNLFNFTSQVKNFNQNFKRKSSPEIIKIVNKKNNNNINNNNNNINISAYISSNKKIKKSSSNDNIFTSTIIHLIECEQK